jgi:hypothetical protein
MSVQRRSLVALFALLLVLALGAPCFAKPTSVSVSLSRTSQFAGATLSPGDYQLVVDGNKITLKKNGKAVAEATGEWKKADHKPVNDYFVFNSDNQIIEIHLRGHDSFLAVGQ